MSSRLGPGSGKRVKCSVCKAPLKPLSARASLGKRTPNDHRWALYLQGLRLQERGTPPLSKQLSLGGTPPREVSGEPPQAPAQPQSQRGSEGCLRSGRSSCFANAL